MRHIGIRPTVAGGRSAAIGGSIGPAGFPRELDGDHGESSLAAFDRGNAQAGINQIKAFQNKVRAQIAKSDPLDAAAFDACISDLIDAINCSATLDLEGVCEPYIGAR